MARSMCRAIGISDVPTHTIGETLPSHVKLPHEREDVVAWAKARPFLWSAATRRRFDLATLSEALKVTFSVSLHPASITRDSRKRRTSRSTAHIADSWFSAGMV